MRTSKFVGNSYIPGHFLSPGSYTSGHVARIHLYTCHHLEHPRLGRHFLLFRVLAKLLMHDTTQCIIALERDLFWVASSGAFVHTFPVVSQAAFMIYSSCFIVYVQVCYLPSSSSGQLGERPPAFIFGDVLFSAISNHLVAWIHIWRLHLQPGDRRFRYAGDRSTPT